ncbi:MAG: serine/threonine-protein kinase [Myxococcota bacterium]
MASKEAPAPGVTQTSDATRIVAGTVLDERFRVIRRLGAGGMGAVYEVDHLVTRHRRALKLLHGEIAKRKPAVERFLREASAAGRIGNPHIVETFDGGWLPGRDEPYLVMELLQGKDLDVRLQEEGAGLPLAEVASIGAQLCEGVQAAHDAGIVHRDLKPENVFLCPREPGWFVKILDFGISKFDERYGLGSQMTTEGTLLGTPLYMSPEQFKDGASVDTRSDVYSLGVMFYECLTGHHPYPASTILELATNILQAEIVPPSERADVPRAVDALLARAMMRDPRDRDLSAAELGRALQAIGSVPPPVLGATGTIVIEDEGEASTPSSDETERTEVATSPPAVDTIRQRPALESKLQALEATQALDPATPKPRGAVPVVATLVLVGVVGAGAWLASDRGDGERSPSPSADGSAAAVSSSAAPSPSAAPSAPLSTPSAPPSTASPPPRPAAVNDDRPRPVPAAPAAPRPASAAARATAVPRVPDDDVAQPDDLD